MVKRCARKVIQTDDFNDDSSLQTRRSSLRVNLSYVSNLSDSGVNSFDMTHETSISETSNKSRFEDCQDATVVNIQREEDNLRRNCIELKDAIINKTKAIFDKPNEVTKKMSEVLRQEIDLVHTSTNANQSSTLSGQVELGSDQILITSGRNHKHLNSYNQSRAGTDETLNKNNESIVATPKSRRRSNDGSLDRSCLSQKRLFTHESMCDKLPLDLPNSPILSQGHQGSTQSKLSRLSLRRSELSSREIEERESSINETADIVTNVPIICSTFLTSPTVDVNIITDKNKECLDFCMSPLNNIRSVDINTTNKNSKTIDVEGSCSTIDLENSRGTTDRSCMEITEVMTTVPILSRSDIKKSRVENVNGELEKQTQVLNFHQQDCSPRTVRSSLAVNTSLDPVGDNLPLYKTNGDVLLKKSKVMNGQRLSIATTVRSSMQVNTSLDSVLDNPVPVKPTRNLLMNKPRVLVVQQLNVSTRRSLLRENTSLDSVKKPSKQRTSTSTVRSSLRVNTSLDSIRRSPAAKDVIDFKRLCTMIEETDHVEEKTDSPRSNENSIDDYIQLENVSLSERIRIMSENQEKSEPKRKSRVSTGSLEIIDPTPYPVSRSMLYKTQIFKNTNFTSKVNDNYGNKDPVRKNKSNANITHSIISDNEQRADLSDTIIVESSLDNTSEGMKNMQAVIIDESLNDTRKSDSVKKTQKGNKRKLFAIRQGSELFSMTPTEENPLSPKIAKPVKKPAPTKTSIKAKERQAKTQVEPVELAPCPQTSQDSSIDNVSMLSLNMETPKKKRRRILSKKIVVKRTSNLNFVQKLCQEMDAEPTERSSERSSLNEFALKKTTKENVRSKNSKTVIVTSGLSKEDKEMVKNAAKKLGKAVVENTVTVRTTHVVSTGVRTINLLRGIIRGCWLVSLEWVQKSLDREMWLDPSPFEMSHFSKAVQENRKDRQLFGKSYVPELFATCGLVFVEKGTSPPPSILKELIKTAGGRTTENPYQAKIIVGPDGFREIWVFDSITTGELQELNEYKWK